MRSIKKPVTLWEKSKLIEKKEFYEESNVLTIQIKQHLSTKSQLKIANDNPLTSLQAFTERHYLQYEKQFL